MARDTNRRAAEAALVISQMLNRVAILAAPRAAQKLPALPSRLSFLEVMDAYLWGLSNFGETTRSSRSVLRTTTESKAKHLRALLVDWTPSPVVPATIQQAARSLIEALGFPSPPEGWENFEGAFDPSQATNDNGRIRIKKGPANPGDPFGQSFNFLVSVLFALASPKRRAGLEAMPSREELAGALQEFTAHVMALPHVSAGSLFDNFRRAVPLARQLFDRLEEWPPSQVPRDVTVAAREVIETMFPGPRDKWDDSWAKQERA